MYERQEGAMKTRRGTLVVAGDANMAYDSKVRDVQRLLAEMDRRLRKHGMRQSGNPVDWSFVGDLESVEARLMELLRFLGGGTRGMICREERKINRIAMANRLVGLAKALVAEFAGEIRQEADRLARYVVEGSLERGVRKIPREERWKAESYQDLVDAKLLDESLVVDQMWDGAAVEMFWKGDLAGQTEYDEREQANRRGELEQAIDRLMVQRGLIGPRAR